MTVLKISLEVIGHSNVTWVFFQDFFPMISLGVPLVLHLEFLSRNSFCDFFLGISLDFSVEISSGILFGILHNVLAGYPLEIPSGIPARNAP